MIELTQHGLFHIQVCTDLPEAEVQSAARSVAPPCGTARGWVLSDDPAHAPVECDTHEGRRHYVLLA